MKTITFKEIANQLNDPDFSYCYLISEFFDGVDIAEATSHHIVDEIQIEFYFECFDCVIFMKDSMQAKTDGNSLFMIDIKGNPHEIRLFKNVRMTF
jgi:hypothetical protein